MCLRPGHKSQVAAAISISKETSEGWLARGWVISVRKKFRPSLCRLILQSSLFRYCKGPCLTASMRLRATFMQETSLDDFTGRRSPFRSYRTLVHSWKLVEDGCRQSWSATSSAEVHAGLVCEYYRSGATFPAKRRGWDRWAEY